MTVRFAPVFALTAAAFATVALTPVASAQFGRTEVSRPDVDEIYADKAMKNEWYDQALERYSATCNDKTRSKETWARNCFKLGNLYRKGQGVPQDYDVARSLFDEACLTGRNADACMQQAYISFEDNDGAHDYTHARALYKQACELGNQTGCGGYGSMLYRGQGGPMDREKGKDYLQNACAAEDSWSCDRVRGYGLPERRGL